MTRALVLGGTGMLGHVLWETCQQRMEAYATVRDEELTGAAAAVLDPSCTLTGVRAEESGTVARALDSSRADAVVNCVGVVKQAREGADPVTSIRINSLFPHELAAACRERGARLIHVSTDCVFAGDAGPYDESDRPDPEDLYGRSKLLGEVSAEGALTLRTSMIGRELETSNGLLEWFLGAAAEGAVRGFTQAVFSGPTAPVLARVIADILERQTGLEGVAHVGAAPINKYDLLLQLRDAFELDVEIEPDDDLVVDRSLDSSRFRSATGWEPPSWPEMIAELSEGAARYTDLRERLAHR